jgi:hypothetical protein
LAWILASRSDPKLHDPAEAFSLATRACELTRYQFADAVLALAAAAADGGRYEQALDLTRQAAALAGKSPSLFSRHIPAMLEAYGAGRPYYVK